MVDVAYISAGVWFVCGVAILYLGYLISIRGRVQLHANYDESSDVDPAYVARWAGGSALVMGLLVIVYAIREAIFGFQPGALAGLILSLVLLSYLSKRFADGWPHGRER